MSTTEPIYAGAGDTGLIRYAHSGETVGALAVEVKQGCGGARGQWVCIEHAEIFHNNMSRDGHTSGPHPEPCRLAWLCLENVYHGCEEA